MTAPQIGLDELLDAAVPFSLPMRRRFRGIDHREGLLLQGPSGWGEWAPFPEYSDAVAALWLEAAVEAAFGQWPEPLRSSVPVNAIIPGTTAADAYELTRAAVRDQGCVTVKVKVGEVGAGLRSVPNDVARVAAVRSALDDAGVGGEARIRVDANTVWTVDEAESALILLDEAARGLDYAEQPCVSLGELAELRRRVGVRIAADESIRTAADPERAAAEGAVDLIVVKVAPLGGVANALRVVRAAGVPCVVSGAMDSAVGLTAGLALAAALPELGGACGLGTGSLLAADVVASPLMPVNGHLAVGRIAPEPEALAAASAAMAPDRALWWRSRLERALGSGRGQ